MTTSIKRLSYSNEKVYQDDSILSQTLGFDISDTTQLEKILFTTINDGDDHHLLQIFDLFPSPTTILQTLLTTTYPNRDSFYYHDSEVILDATELLGPSLTNLNAIHIACLLGEEEMALHIIEFVVRITDEIQARKILYEFLGRVWGDGNTALHLASFLGMSELVKKLIELGAATSKSNDRKYKPVDCAGDDITRMMFETVTEIDAGKRKGLNMRSTLDVIATSPTTLTPLQGLLPLPQSPLDLNHSPRSPIDNTDPMKSHTRTASFDFRTRSQSSPKVRPQRSSTSVAFQASSLNKSHTNVLASFLSPQRKSVKFNPATLLLHLCSLNDNSDENYNAVLQCLGLNDSNHTDIDVNNIYMPHQWLTPLHLACSHGLLKITELLLTRAGAAVNIRDKEGWTPLHCAAAEGHIDIIKFLSRCQGNVLIDDIKRTESWVDVLDGPIELNPLNFDGDLPEQVSLDSKEEEITQILEDLRKQYPQPIQTPMEQDESDEEEEEEEEEVVEKEDVKPAFTGNFKRSPSIMKSAFRRKDTDEDKKDDKDSLPKLQTNEQPISKKEQTKSDTESKEEKKISSSVEQLKKKSSLMSLSESDEEESSPRSKTIITSQDKPKPQDKLKTIETLANHQTQSDVQINTIDSSSAQKFNDVNSKENIIPSITVAENDLVKENVMKEKVVKIEVSSPLKEKRTSWELKACSESHLSDIPFMSEDVNRNSVSTSDGSDSTATAVSEVNRKQRIFPNRKGAVPVPWIKTAITELETEKPKHIGEHMKRPADLQRRSSKGQGQRDLIPRLNPETGLVELRTPVSAIGDRSFGARNGISATDRLSSTANSPTLKGPISDATEEKNKSSRASKTDEEKKLSRTTKNEEVIDSPTKVSVRSIANSIVNAGADLSNIPKPSKLGSIPPTNNQLNSPITGKTVPLQNQTKPSSQVDILKTGTKSEEKQLKSNSASFIKGTASTDSINSTTPNVFDNPKDGTELTFAHSKEALDNSLQQLKKTGTVKDRIKMFQTVEKEQPPKPELGRTWSIKNNQLPHN